MGPTDVTAFILLIANGIVSWKGFRDPDFFYLYTFQVEKVRLHKDYKRLLTSGFLHVSWIHLIFNMLVLYSFAGSLAHALGIINTLIIYFASLIGGNLFSLFIHRNEPSYTAVGASGAVSGLVFASIALFPGMQIGLLFIPFSIPGWLFGLIFVLISIFGIHSQTDNIGHDAHLGGGLIGMIAAIIIVPKALSVNYFPILIIVLPATVFIYLFIMHPELLSGTKSPADDEDSISPYEDPYNARKHREQKELNGLLDKINKKGLSSLTQEEKQRLEELSDRF